ncbi:hypothetical protein [Proteiniclasticum sp. QWL-01]|uniref:hypothetical protein n=1 Tax=Proteiniclasticum sp. QWL-01 TaxID=3036945 RepID=UPI002410FD67|nr:hypothetical protein [Proteiniclasticum sp. QWL-01]WFF73986.1 hypothetical protein P6M73_05935 [Proteiniclasticum sp. QWL-01]
MIDEKTIKAACETAICDTRERYSTLRVSGYSFDDLLPERYTIWILETSRNAFYKQETEKE